jgi:fimbrial chaperone protein
MSHLVRWSFLIALCWCAPPAAWAVGLAVNQTTLVFALGSDAQALTVGNPESTPTQVQVRVFRWDMQDARDIYVATGDIGFSPAIFRLQPKATQVVRLVMLAPRTGGEQAYRVFVDQLSAAQTVSSKVNLPVRFVIPVFVQGNGPAKAQLHFSVVADHKLSRASLTATNDGDAHARLSDIVWQEVGQGGVIAAGLAGYVLPRHSRTWTFAMHGAPTVLHLKAHSDHGDIDETVPVMMR